MGDDMKEIRDAALAYYHNLSQEQQKEVYAFFQALDADGDGAITIKEFKQILETSSSESDVVSVNTLFREMDKNGDGILNFEEAITFYYVCCNDRLIGCDGCKASFIKGLYFTCVDCFERNQSTTFDLCISCYGSRNYVHEHCNFLDNYALLRTKSAYSNTTSTNQPARSANMVDESDDYYSRKTSKAVSDDYYSRKTSKARFALKAINGVTEIGNAAVAAGACIIM